MNPEINLEDKKDFIAGHKIFANKTEITFVEISNFFQLKEENIKMS